LEIKFAIHEERLSRVKHDARFPVLAIGHALEACGIGINDLDRIVFYEEPSLKLNRLWDQVIDGWPRSRRMFTDDIPRFVQYKLPIAESVGKISLGATYTHTDANQVHTQFFAPTTFKVPAQDLLNANVDWKGVGGTPIDLAFFVTNLTNQKKIVYPIATYQTTGAESVYLNLPRMWGFRLKYHFGD